MRSELPATFDRRTCAPRQGFTIVELLVTLAVMAVLAAMTVFAMGPLQDRSAQSGGAALVQTWLNTARQRAIRDKVPSGLRFLAGTTLPAQGTGNPYYVTRLVYLEGGTELFGTLYLNGPSSGPTTFSLQTPLPSTINPVLGAKGTTDAIIINSGLPHQITSGAGTSITIPTAWPYAIPFGAALPYRIIRGPVAISGNGVGTDSDNILTMPRGSCVNFDPQNGNPTLYPQGIDLGNYNVNHNTSLNFIPKVFFTGVGSVATPTGTIANPISPSTSNLTNNGLDIMFAPDGTVMSPATNYPIVFWISGTTAFLSGGTTPTIDAMRGNPSLVAVYPRTGQVISYQVEFDVIPGLNKANATSDVL